MMKILYSYSLFFALLTISNGKWLKTNDNHDIRSISAGSMVGKCRDYCRRSINITSIPLQVDRFITLTFQYGVKIKNKYNKQTKKRKKIMTSQRKKVDK
jgi:hypothetical protein